MNRTAVAVIVLALGAGGMLLASRYREGRQEREREESREEAVVAPSRVTGDEDGSLIRLDSSEARSLGIVVEPLRPARGGVGFTLHATVIPDSARIAMVRAPFAGRLDVASEASWPELGSRVAAGTPLARIADAKPVAAPRGGVVTMVSARPGEMVQAGQPLLAITDDSQPLIRVAWGDGAPGRAPSTLVVQDIDRRHAPVVARLVGPAPEVDPLTRQPAWFYRMRHGWPGLAVGLPVISSIPTAATARGAWAIPAAAAVQWDGLVWVYVERRPGEFRRVRVPTDAPLARGWAVADGFESGDRVVTRGAGQLLSEEFRSRVIVGEEVGE